MIKPDKEYIDELIISFLSKGATPEELEYLLQWIETDSNNREYYQHMYMAWLQNASINQLPLEHEKRALQQTQRKILDINRKKPVRNAQKITLPRSIFKYAAAIAFILVIATYSITRYTINQQPDSQISEMIYEAHYGSRAYATLPDGSKVWLNSGSKLSVQSGYNLHERKVQLIGEAYFEVQTNPEKPFIVKAREISIRATGTTFNVKAYPEEEQITTTLVTGIVFIEGHDDKEKEFKIKMTPSQTICYNTKQSKIEEDVNVVTASTKTRQQNNTDKPLPSITVNQVKTEAITSWMKDRWIIENEDFGSLAKKLERRYNVEIQFISDKLKNYRFTGTIERETLEQMFDAFRYSIPLQYTINRGIVSLTIDKELEQQYEKAWKHN